MNTTNITDKTMVDVHRLLKALWKKKFVIAVVSVLCAIMMTVGTMLFSKPKYRADILVYVNNHTLTLGSEARTFSSGELTAAKQLRDTYIVALKSRTVLDAVIQSAGLPYSRLVLADMISAESVNNTEWFSVSVLADTAEEAQLIADTIAEILPDVLSDTIDGSSVKVLDYANKPQEKVDPGYVRMAEIGFIAGFMIIVLIIAAKEILNDKIHGEDTLTELTDAVPILATIPHKGTKGKYGRYGYGQKKNVRGTAARVRSLNEASAVCRELGFAQTEAYNLLQTSVQYSFSKSDGGRFIGITSSERNEGKSTLSVNLAYSLSCDKQKVLLLEGDMRLPSIAKKLEIESAPGLSDYLTGKIPLEDSIRYSRMAPSMPVICAGVVPPNPFRLLGSAGMEQFVAALRKEYDYIIVDLPPVNIVSDPLSIAKYLDGFIIAVRSDFSTRQGVRDVVKKLQVVNANILGFVVNEDASAAEKRYGRYGKYGKYGKYGTASDDYEKSYEHAAAKKPVRVAPPEQDDNPAKGSW